MLPRSIMHRVFLDQVIPDGGERLVLEGEEAAHAARVKRVAIGEAIGLLDGAGVVAEARVAAVHKPARAKDGPTVELEVVTRRELPRPQPVLDVFTATPKGGRVDEMVDQFSQIGAAAWGPLQSARGVVDPRESKLERLERIAREAAKQSGRAWVLQIERPLTLEQALRGGDRCVVMADATGEAFGGCGEVWERGVRLLVGPEGGWTGEELNMAKSAGARIVRFGPHIMRIETAAVAAAAVIMAGTPA